MESKIKSRLQYQNGHKVASYQPKEIDQTPKKQNVLIKFEENDAEQTLQKNILHLMERSKMNGIQIFRQSKKIKRPWTKEEDDQLKRLVETKGAKQWAHISSFFEERCGKQCRERWHNHLRNGIRKGDWTSEEEWTLFLGVQAYGKKWSTISKMLEGRTQNTLKNHWNCKMKPKKAYLEKRLEFLLRQDDSQSLTEKKLFQIIKEKKGLKESRVDTLIKVLQDSLLQFFMIKEEILRNHQSNQSSEVNAYLKKRKVYDMYSFGSFGKNKNFEGTTCQRKKEKSQKDQRRETIQQINDNDHWNQQQHALRPFELDSSDDLSAKEHDMDMESSVKSSTLRDDIFYEKSEVHNDSNESEYEGNSEQEQQKGDFCDKFEAGDFCSPFKPNIFESIDLGESNQMKRLFDE